MKEIKDGVMTLIINRSKKINSLNLGMFVIITKYMNQADKDDNIKIIIIKGTKKININLGKGKNFSSGDDLGVID